MTETEQWVRDVAGEYIEGWSIKQIAQALDFKDALLAALREDAERYRWLRQQSRGLWKSIGWNTWEDPQGVPEFIMQCRDNEIDELRAITTPQPSESDDVR